MDFKDRLEGGPSPISAMEGKFITEVVEAAYRAKKVVGEPMDNPPLRRVVIKKIREVYSTLVLMKEYTDD